MAKKLEDESLSSESEAESESEQESRGAEYNDFIATRNIDLGQT